MAKTLEFGIPTGQTCTAKLFVLGAASDTVAETLGTVTEKTNDKGTATATVTVSGWHRIKVFVGSSPVAEWYADVKAADPSTTIAIDLSAVDWSQVYAPTSTVGLSGTTIATSQVVASVSGAVGSVTNRVTANSDQIAGSATAATTIAAMNSAFKSGTVDTSTFTATTTVFETSRTDNSDEYTAQALLWTSGANAGLTSRIASYVFSANSKDKLTLAAATPNTPANGDTFYVLGRIE